MLDRMCKVEYYYLIETNNAPEGKTMSLIKIQEFAIGAFRVSSLAKCKKGQTIKARFEAVRAKYIGMLVERGWNESDAAIVIKDAEDMAMLELSAA